jgi:phosphoribosylformimino-5-aminoimidazole carboxamide ribotide isomerase
VELIAAIDLLGGRGVRLRKGDYDHVVGGVDPVELARRWAAAGVPRLHVVDLDGARAGEPRHAAVMARIFGAAREASSGIGLQAGGGLRTEAAVEAVLEAGADAAVLGTAALTNPGFLRDCAARWPGRMLVSLDVRGAELALDGWLRSGADDPLQVAARLLDDGAAGLIVTDTQRDGTLAGPNLQLLRGVRGRFPGARLVAAGGVGSSEDLLALADEGVDGVIVGMALLTGQIDLGDALARLDAREDEQGAPVQASGAGR